MSFLKKLVKKGRKLAKGAASLGAAYAPMMPGPWGLGFQAADSFLNARMEPNMSEPGIGYGAGPPPCVGDDCPEAAAFAQRAGVGTSAAPPEIERRFIDVFVRRPRVKAAMSRLGGLRSRHAKRYGQTRRSRRIMRKATRKVRRRKRMSALQAKYFGKRRRRTMRRKG